MKVQIFFLLLLLVTFVVADDTNLTFIQWQIKNSVIISPIGDIVNREKIFFKNRKLVRDHNSDPDKTYEQDLNIFSHLTTDEFIEYRCGTKLPERLANGSGTTTDPKLYPNPPLGKFTSSTAPNSTNFINLMQPVLFQGRCNACWAFSAMAQIEAMMKQRNPAYSTQLSPQYLIDCDYYNYGCGGGWPSDSMYWLQIDGDNKAPSLAAYPYRGTTGLCRSLLATIPIGINAVIENFLRGDENAMKVQIASYGPTVAVIQVTRAFQQYKSGVFYDPNCPSGKQCNVFNHAVVIVGYGTDPLLGDYWLIKNSWGNGWGEKGYMRLARNRRNSCNIACYAIFSE